MNKIRLALAAGTLALAGTSSAYAGDVGWSISIGSPGVYHHHYAPRVYYEPRVIYEPRVVYSGPAPIYFHYYDAPRRHYHRPHSYYGGHHGHHHRHHKHGWKGHRGRD